MATVDEIITEAPKPDAKYPIIYQRTVRHWTDHTKTKVERIDTYEQARIWPDGSVEVLSPRRRVGIPYKQRVEDGQRVYLWVDKFGGIECLKERKPA